MRYSTLVSVLVFAALSAEEHDVFVCNHFRDFFAWTFPGYGGKTCAAHVAAVRTRVRVLGEPLQQELRVKEPNMDVGIDSFTVFDLPRSASSIDLLLGIRHRLKLS